MDNQKLNNNYDSFKNELIASAGSGGSATTLVDDDGDTKVQVEEGADDDTIRFDCAGNEKATINDTTNVSVVAGSVGTPALNFIGDTNTGIYRPGADQVGISAAGTLEAAVSASHLSVDGGSVGTPGVNFGITGTDTDTGIFRINANQVGVSAGGAQQLAVLNANSLNNIKGINIGTALNIGGIRRLSATVNNSWEDGFMGSSSAIVFTPTDFVCGASTAAAGRYQHVESSQGNPGARGSRWYGSSIVNGELCAQKIIPKGFGIIRGESQVRVFTPAGAINNCTLYVSAQAANIGGSTILTPLASTSTYSTNSGVTTGPGAAIGDGLNMVTIWIDCGITLDETNSISGAIITMQRV